MSDREATGKWENVFTDDYYYPYTLYDPDGKPVVGGDAPFTRVVDLLNTIMDDTRAKDGPTE